MKKYWETETPTTVDTGKNILRYFAEAGKLQVSMPYWGDENKPGKTVTVNVAAIMENTEALELMRRIFGGANE